MVASMRLKDKIKTQVLKSLISDATYSLKSENPSHPMDILLKSIKKRSDALQEYKKASRLDLLQTEQDEISILEKYLPKKKTDQEIVSTIQKALKNLEEGSKPDFGKLMKSLVLELNSAEAPRETLSKLLKSEIQKLKS